MEPPLRSMPVAVARVIAVACAVAVACPGDGCEAAGMPDGIRPRRQSDRRQSRGRDKTALVVMLVLGGFALLCCAGLGTALFVPAVQQARIAAGRAQCMNNLKNIGIAVSNHNTVQGSLPAPAAGQPLVSWRTQMVLDQMLPGPGGYDPSAAWDAATNQPIQTLRPEAYLCPALADDANPAAASYVYAIGEGSLWVPPPGEEQTHSPTLDRVRDGLSNTILAVERTHDRPVWTEPRDSGYAWTPHIGVDPEHPDPLASASHGTTSSRPGEAGRLGGTSRSGGANVLFMDGSVRFVSESISEDDLFALTTASGGEVVTSF